MQYRPMNVPKLVAAFETAAHEAVLDVAERVLARATAETPIDTGRLKASGHVEPGPDPGVAYVVFDATSDQGFGYPVVVHVDNPWLARATLAEKTEAFARFQTAVNIATATS